MTLPEACTAFAMGGDCGCGKLVALPLSTPPEIGAVIFLGVGAGGGSSDTEFLGVALKPGGGGGVSVTHSVD
ncbi:MAG: hypothetical protein ACMG6H_15740, partial [Acidobacteriota bacterium]